MPILYHIVLLLRYMATPKQERRSNIIFWFSLIVAKLSFALLFVLIGVEMYVRWTLNQNFAFLPGFGLEALTFSVFGLTGLLAYIHTSKNSG